MEPQPPSEAEILAIVDLCTPEDKREKVKTKWENHLQWNVALTVMIEYMWYHIWTDEQKKDIERAIELSDASSPYFLLLMNLFNMKQHFINVYNHKQFIGKAYHRFKDYLTKMKPEQVVTHDLTKRTLVQALGYTTRWVHENSDVFAGRLWRAAIDHHYRHEPHHPQHYQHYQPGEDGNEGDMTQEDMPQEYLEEAFIDMIACRWERTFQGREDVTDAELVSFEPAYLERFTDRDCEKIKLLVKVVQQKYC